MRQQPAIGDARSIFEAEPVLYIHPNRVGEWLPDLPAGAAKQLMACRRLTGRLSALIFHRYDLPPVPAAFFESTNATVTGFDYPLIGRLIGVAGAVWHKAALKRLINRDALQPILTGFDDVMMRLVATATYQTAHSSPDGAPPIPNSEMIWESGKLCFCAWLDSVPQGVQARVVLKFPSDFERGPVPSEYRKDGPELVRTIARGLLANDQHEQ